ncbi:MAG: TrkA family potassium uptake protein [Promicromonosporaceae bacterium]|nr:TrkA family potassium uptake protein [Promicromonosporaceae bacterium]
MRKQRVSVADAGVLVLGLGRFGQSIAAKIDQLGLDVLAVEKDPALITQWSGRLPLVQADAANPEALEQLGAGDFPVAVVAIGTALESSMLATANLVDLGVQEIWVKATSVKHGRILQRIGAHHIVFPEQDAGARVAHLVSGRMLDFIELEDDFSIVKMRPPLQICGRTVGDIDIEGRYGVRVIGVKSPGKEFVYVNRRVVVSPEDLIVVGGQSGRLEAFAALG